MITYTIMGAPYCKHSNNGPQTPSLIIKAPILRYKFLSEEVLSGGFGIASLQAFSPSATARFPGAATRILGL